MKLLSWKRVKMPGDKVRVEAQWSDKMRRRSSVRVVEVVHQPNSQSPSDVVIEGESADVFKTLSGLAALAWEMGWRPPGLVNAVAATVQEFKHGE